MKETFNTLRNNLTRSYIFYVPSKVYDDVQRTQLKDMIPYHLTNTIVYMDDDRKTIEDISEFNKVEIISKNSLFDENIFTLIDAQSKLSAPQFKHLINKYWEHVETHTYLTNLMYTHLSEYIKDASKNVSDMFLLQKDYFSTHHTEIKRTFGALLTSRFTNALISYNKKPVQTKKQKPKKPQIISDEDADVFLLETVFNIPSKMTSKIVNTVNKTKK
ncbi:hypothetical protein [Mangrovimonas spongiae]|uniref:Uncharacterized protein n=1 Tax=Mangrovimonas spongiae TaxID=2494697 RepID=A0A3R9MH62_9FLAO|nr:hypothetical protein [Mangrovimonas spongiae]RSK40401.1 hypothetical protein EJA19_05325 [Mangrovimonas spongiae]